MMTNTNPTTTTTSANTAVAEKQKNALDDFHGMINQTYYDPIRVILSESQEGVLKDYRFKPPTEQTEQPEQTEQIEQTEQPQSSEYNGWMVVGC